MSGVRSAFNMNNQGKIFDRLGDIRSGVELQKDKIMQDATSRLEDLFSSLEDFQVTIGRDVAELREEIMRVERIVDQGDLPTDKSYVKSHDSKRLQEKYGRHIEIEMTERKEGELRLMRMVDERCSTQLLHIHQQAKTREEMIGDLKSSLGADLPRLSYEIEQEEKNRQYCDTEMMQEIAEGLSIRASEMNSLREVRGQSEESIYQMLKEVLVRVGEQLELQRGRRETTEQTILMLIEGMCDKVVIKSSR